MVVGPLIGRQHGGHGVGPLLRSQGLEVAAQILIALASAAGHAPDGVGDFLEAAGPLNRSPALTHQVPELGL